MAEQVDKNLKTIDKILSVIDCGFQFSRTNGRINAVEVKI